VPAVYDNIKDWIIDVRRDFHQYPELGMEEIRTSKKIADYLREMNIEVREGIAGTGVVGIIRGAVEGKTVALRADMDALPIVEERNAEYKSKVVGKMHGCGHDAHTAILLGAAKVLSGMKKELKGNVVLIFQPAEETTGGAKPMIEAGVLENPHVDAIFGLHVEPELETGTIGIKYGKAYASSDMVDLIISGKSSHGAYPHAGIDAIATAAHVITALQTIVGRNVDPRDGAVLSIGTINGGSARNIICDHVEMKGTIRTLNPETRTMVLRRAKDIVEKVCDSMGTKGEFIRYESYPSLINHESYVDVVKNSGEKLLGKDKIITIQETNMGVEDFAYFLEKVPGAFYYLGCRNQDKEIIYPLHNSLFDIDEACLLIGVSMQVENVKSILNM